MADAASPSQGYDTVLPTLAQVSVQQRGSYLWLAVPFALREAVRSIGCFSWNAATKTWFGPATPVVAARLQRVFPSLVTDANFERLIRSYQVAETARQVISNGALPPIPLTKTKPWRHQVAGYWFASTIWGWPPGATEPTHASGGGVLEAMAMGTGKAQPLTCKVLTPTGWRRMGDLKVWDEVIAENGYPTRITGVYDRGVLPCYRVTFSDGSSTECSGDHLWQVETAAQRYAMRQPRKWRLLRSAYLLSTEEMVQQGLTIAQNGRTHERNNRRWFIPMVTPVHFGETQSLPMNPYLLGVLLGDGDLHGTATLTTADTEILEHIRPMLPQGVKIRRYVSSTNGQAGQYGLSAQRGKGNALLKILEGLGLRGAGSENKFVPKAYLLAEPEARLAVLQGLCDTDGYVDKRQHGRTGVEYSTASPQLAADTIFLVQSLGGKASVRKRAVWAVFRGKRLPSLPSYRIWFSLPGQFTPFRLTRKLQRSAPPSKYPPHRAIVRIEPIGEKPARCISIADSSGLYVTDDFIVTHNSALAINLINNFGFKRVLISCPLSVVDVWPLQFQLHSASGARIVPLGSEYKSVQAKAMQAAVEIERAKRAQQPVVVITNHETVWREPFQTLALKADFDCMVCDESHKLKDPGGRAANFVAKLALRVPYRLLLTGTPLPHGPFDAFAQYRILDPGIFGTSFTMFRQEYAVTQEMKTRKGQPFQKILKYKNQDKLQRLFFSRAFRVEKDVLDLPPELDTQRNCALGPEAQRVYKALEKDFIADVQSGKITVANVLVRLLRLQQISSGWVTLDPPPGSTERRIVDIDTSKANLLADLLDDIEPGEPIVVFARFRHDLDIIKAISTASKRRVAELSGRRNELAVWQQGKAEVLVAQIQAGGLGVDMTRARYCLFHSLGLSNGDYRQARARIHRPGQTRPVEYVHLVARDTTDTAILKALAMRQDVVDAILNLAKREGRLF